MSRAFSFVGVDWAKIGRGALVAVVGALVVYFTDLFANFDWSAFGPYAPIVTAVAGILVNIGRKFVSENQ